MKMRIKLFALLLLIANSSPGGDPQSLTPCKSPKELLTAVKNTLELQDTNAFWKLHVWTNVPPRDEQLHKTELLNTCFKSPEVGSTISFSAFSIRPAPDKATMATLGFAHNIPLEGMIHFNTRKIIPTQFQGSPIKMAGEHDCFFGRGTDGNYWLAVSITPANAKQPVKRPLQ